MDSFRLIWRFAQRIHGDLHSGHINLQKERYTFPGYEVLITIGLTCGRCKNRIYSSLTQNHAYQTYRPDPAADSDLVNQDDMLIGLSYEHDYQDGIANTSFMLDWPADGQDSLNSAGDFNRS